MRRDRFFFCSYLAALVLSACILDSCDDDENPVAGTDTSDILLATFSGGVFGSGWSTPPPMPLTAKVEFGVADPSDPTSDDPDPMLHYDGLGNRRSKTYSEGNTPDFATVAARLTDGVDEATLHGVIITGSGGGSQGGLESGLEYSPSITRTGPDLTGFVVTRIIVRMDKLTASQSGPPYTLEATYTGTIRGHEE